VITGAVAGVGVTNAALVNLAALAILLPQLDVYCNLTLSAPAAALLLKVTVITLEPASPESITALLPNVVFEKLHNQPVGAANVAVADGTVTGAAYLYLLAPHTFV
jgi:hypothetical protein